MAHVRERSVVGFMPALQRPTHRCPPNLERIGNLSGPHALSLHGAHRGHINRGRPAPVDTFGLGPRNPFKLTFAATNYRD